MKIILVILIIAVGCVNYQSEMISSYSNNKTLNYGVMSIPKKLDYQRMGDIYSYTILKPVILNLVTYNSSNLLKPGLAKYWTISKDKTNYVFTLRENLFYHDDSKFSCKDIEKVFLSLKKMKDLTLENVEQFYCTNNIKFNVKLKHPSLHFLNKLTLPKLSLSKVDKNGNTIGLGAYRIKKKEDNQVILEKYIKNLKSLDIKNSIPDLVIFKKVKSIKESINYLKNDKLDIVEVRNYNGESFPEKYVIKNQIYSRLWYISKGKKSNSVFDQYITCATYDMNLKSFFDPDIELRSYFKRSFGVSVPSSNSFLKETDLKNEKKYLDSKCSKLNKLQKKKDLFVEIIKNYTPETLLNNLKIRFLTKYNINIKYNILTKQQFIVNVLSKNYSYNLASIGLNVLIEDNYKILLESSPIKLILKKDSKYLSNLISKLEETNSDVERIYFLREIDKMIYKSNIFFPLLIQRPFLLKRDCINIFNSGQLSSFGQDLLKLSMEEITKGCNL